MVVPQPLTTKPPSQRRRRNKKDIMGQYTPYGYPPSWSPCIEYNDQGDMRPGMSQPENWRDGLYVLRHEYESVRYERDDMRRKLTHAWNAYLGLLTDTLLSDPVLRDDLRPALQRVMAAI